ncbi:MAG: TIGR04063 family PEP-CTERM/XrtA system glycosyltransferase [Sphingomonadaceae bacterium]
MRILHILDHSLPLHSGYTFRTRAILKAQQARGWDVIGVTGARHTAAGPAVETVDGLTFHRSAPATPARSPLGEWREIAAMQATVSALVDEWRPDLLHAHSPVLTALAGLRVATAHKLPLLYEIRAFWEDAAVGNGTGTEGSLKYRATKALETYAVKRADAVAVICDGLKSDLISRGIAPGKIMVSPNGVDLDLFGDPLPRDTALAATIGLGAGAVIGYIGSFYDYEGIDDLIAAMPAIIAAHPDTALLLVGGGPVEAALRAQAHASPVADKIHFIGRVPHEEVDRYYSLIDVLAYPRKKMRLTDLVTPLKPLEAMAQRRLVAASHVGGHRELIEDGVTGTLFSPDDPTAAASKINALLGDRAMWEERRRTARAFVETNRNWSSNISRYDAIYHKLTGLPV